jgi:hypothetical protein
LGNSRDHHQKFKQKYFFSSKWQMSGEFYFTICLLLIVL